jgi:hypothetical protein
MVLVQLQLVMKQQFFILHLELHQQTEPVQKYLKKRAHSLELFQLMEAALQLQSNCTQFIELEQHQDSLGLLHHLDMEKLEPHTVMVERPLTMKHSSFIPQSEPQAEMVMALQHPLRSRLL